MAAEDHGGHLDRAGVGRCFGDVGVPGIQAGIGHGKRRGAPPAVRARGRLVAGGRFGEHEPGDAVVQGEPGRVPAGGDDVRGGGEVDLDGAAEPGAVPSAGPLVSGMRTGTGSCCPCRAAQRRQAMVARVGGRPSSRCRRVRERVPQGGFAGPGERGQVPMSAGCGWPVAARSSQAAARAAKGREAGGDGAGRRWLAAAMRDR